MKPDWWITAVALGALTNCGSPDAAMVVAPDPVAASSAGLRADAVGVIEAAASKLGPARVVRVSVEHLRDPELGLGTAIDEGTIEVVMQRPNRFYALYPAGAETRELAYDGEWLCVMHPEVGHHALEPVRATTIEAFALEVDERFGFRPPLAGLLAGDMVGELLVDVTGAILVGSERVGGSQCDRVHLWQEGMTTDLWVARDDHLPRRMLLTMTGLPGNPTWDLRFSGWELDSTADPSLFSKRPAPGSVKVQMFKSR